MVQAAEILLPQSGSGSATTKPWPPRVAAHRSTWRSTSARSTLRPPVITTWSSRPSTTSRSPRHRPRSSARTRPRVLAKLRLQPVSGERRLGVDHDPALGRTCQASRSTRCAGNLVDRAPRRRSTSHAAPSDEALDSPSSRRGSTPPPATSAHTHERLRPAGRRSRDPATSNSPTSARSPRRLCPAWPRAPRCSLAARLHLHVDRGAARACRRRTPSAGQDRGCAPVA